MLPVFLGKFCLFKNAISITWLSSALFNLLMGLPWLFLVISYIFLLPFSAISTCCLFILIASSWSQKRHFEMIQALPTSIEFQSVISGFLIFLYGLTSWQFWLSSGLRVDLISNGHVLFIQLYHEPVKEPSQSMSEVTNLFVHCFISCFLSMSWISAILKHVWRRD